jgi:hypothetical protein
VGSVDVLSLQRIWIPRIHVTQLRELRAAHERVGVYSAAAARRKRASNSPTTSSFAPPTLPAGVPGPIV